jgi:hydrogenase nickel incorporation protein HypA/HybF
VHEEAMVRDLVRRAEEIRRAEGTARLASVRVWLGALAHCSEDGLRGRWAIAVRDTPLASARLEVDVSEDADDPRAQSIVLESVGVDPPEGEHAR